MAVIVKLAPTIKSCIDATAQREYWRRVQEYLLRGFLESANFSKLTSQSEKHLSDGKRVHFNLSTRNGEPTHEMIVEEGP